MRQLLMLAAAWAVGCQSKGAPPDQGASPEKAPAAVAVEPGVPIEGHLVSQATIDRVAEQGTRQQWFGLYIHDKKVGYASIQLRPAASGEPGGVVWAVSARLRTGIGGDTADVDLDEQRFYQAAAPYRLVEVRSRETSAGGSVERSFRLKGDQLLVVQTVDGRAQPERRIAASKETLLSVLDQQAVEPGEVKVGMSVMVPELETDAEADKLTAIKVVEVRQQRLSGVDTRVVVLSSQSEGEQTVANQVIASGAVVLNATLGGGIELRWEERQQAESNLAGFDIIADAVVVDRPIGDAAKVRELHLVVQVPPSFRLRDAPNQELARRPDGALDVALYARPGLPVLDTERKKALESTSSIDAGDPMIAGLAREIVAGEADPTEQVARLIAWTYRNLEKDLSSNLTTASQVLARKQGDCTEHSLLFVALARAVGIPAREVSGLVYMGDDIQRFGWHAWAEVALDGRWVQVDPSWGEPLANATHLTLGVGDDNDWIAALGALTIRLAPQ
jgi:hypothetical protein